jgi:hypothetical protein
LYDVRLPIYVCPSSAHGTTNVGDIDLSDNSSNSGQVSMVMDYVGISGATPDPSPTPRTNVCTGDYLANGSSSCKSGLLVPFESKRFRDCIDGTSNTIILGEQSGQVNGRERSANALGGWHGYANVGGASAWNAGSTLPLSSGGYWYTAGLTTVRYPPNAYWRSGAPTPAGSQYSANTLLNSFHTGGIHAVLADGSVRFISENIDMHTLRCLCVRDDGQVIGEF